MNTQTNFTTHGQGNYGAKLFDPRWKAKRQSILDRDKNQCVNCSSTEKLHVHHKQYHFAKTLKAFLNPWDYNDRILITLCEKCHNNGHELYKIPTKYIK